MKATLCPQVSDNITIMELEFHSVYVNLSHHKCRGFIEIKSPMELRAHSFQLHPTRLIWDFYTPPHETLFFNLPIETLQRAYVIT